RPGDGGHKKPSQFPGQPARRQGSCAQGAAGLRRGDLQERVGRRDSTFARSLCNDPSQADDLAQEALAKAWKARDSFEPGTSIKAWTFMILRNQFYSEKRRSWRTAPLDVEMAENTLLDNDDPTIPMDLLELRAALAKLPDDQREALILVGAGGMAY